MMHWQRPTPEQKARGIVACLVYRMTTRCGNAYAYEQVCPLGVAAMNRRIARGGSLPRWITAKPTNITEDVDYWLAGDLQPEHQARLNEIRQRMAS